MGTIFIIFMFLQRDLEDYSGVSENPVSCVMLLCHKDDVIVEESLLISTKVLLNFAAITQLLARRPMM